MRILSALFSLLLIAILPENSADGDSGEKGVYQQQVAYYPAAAPAYDLSQLYAKQAALAAQQAAAAAAAAAPPGGGGGGGGAGDPLTYVTVPLPGLSGFAGSRKKRGAGDAGMMIDLMEMIGIESGLNFKPPKIVPEFGKEVMGMEGRFNGAVGEITGGTAEIAAAALEPTKGYMKAIDFSIPLFQSTVQIIYTKEHGLNEETKIAIMDGTATRDWLEKSQNPQHQRLWAKISANAPTSLVTTYSDAMELLDSGKKWAFIGRTPAIDNSVVQSNGKLIKHPKVWRTVYGCLGMKKNSVYRSQINKAIAKLQESGGVDDLLLKYFPNSTLGVCSTAEPKPVTVALPPASTTTPPPLF